MFCINRYISKIIFVVLTFVLIIILGNTIQLLLEESQLEWIQYITINISRILLVIVFFVLIYRYNLLKYNGLHDIGNVKDPVLVIRVAIAITVGLILVWSRFQESDWSIVTSFIVGHLLVGFVEELSFRGLVLPLFIGMYIQQGEKQVLLKAVLYSSLIFGLLHFINLISNTGNIKGIMFQVFFATSIGIFLAGFMLRTGSIILTCFVHTLVNIIINSRAVSNSSDIVTAGTTDLSSLLITLAVFTTIFLFSLRMLKKVSLDSLNIGT